MDAEIKPHAARKMREAFQNIPDRALETDHKAIECTWLETRSPLAGSPRDKVQLVLMKDDKTIAYVMIDNAVLKRLKREIGFWKNMKTGAALVNRHGSGV